VSLAGQRGAPRGLLNIAGRWPCVRARALSICQIVLFTSSAVGAVLWGIVAQRTGLVTAFVLAGVVLVVATGGVRYWPLITPLAADRRAISYWPDPSEVTESGTGPVLVVVRYQVSEARRAAFVRALPALRRSRLRSGATSWQIHRDTTGSEFVEHFEQVSWADHLDQHHERLTEADRTIQQRVNAEAQGAPVVEHLFASDEPPGHVPVADSPDPQEGAGRA
jgi:Transmembrane secretion effector